MNSLLQYSDLPNLAGFKADEIKPAIDEAISKADTNLQNTLKLKNIIWEDLLKLEEDDETITQICSSISHLNAVCNTPELRDGYEYTVAKLTEFYTKVGQNKELFEVYKNVQKQNLNEEQTQAVAKAIKGFEASGVDLEESKRQRLQQISQELAQLSTKFENNVLDATMHWVYATDDISELQGLPQSTIDAAIEKSKQKETDKKYTLGIDIPTYIAVMQQTDNRTLREKFYKAYCTKASKNADDTSFDNDDIIKKTLELRIEKSNILGFESYAEYSLYTKMAETPNQVLELLNSLLEKSKSQAQAELKELKDFAKNLGFDNDLKPWDVSYYSEKLKKAKYDFTAEELREYFPLEKVQSGLFEILNKIYGLEVKENTSYVKYIAEQQSFEFYKDNAYVGTIICDYFARDNKRGGAWMDGSRTAYLKSDNTKQSPVAYVTCNFLSPSKDGANLTHNDVVTLFHEFGHALHHILSKVSVPSISGTNGVEWDAVELPSQFMENFCWCKEGLNLMSGSRDGKKLTDEQIQKLSGTRHFQSALGMARQLEFAIFDMNIHHKKCVSVEGVQAELDAIRSNLNLMQTPSYNKFQNGFSHIFAGGYAAGYYSYKWAEILSSDVFSRFEDEGILNSEVGQDLLENIISKGSARDAMDNFVAFMGRKPSEEALLRHSGIRL
ncbi:M3 family metallopeptidase [Francisellaceae bacterium CB52]|jgi:oligopeptidase A